MTVRIYRYDDNTILYESAKAATLKDALSEAILSGANLSGIEHER